LPQWCTKWSVAKLPFKDGEVVFLIIQLQMIIVWWAIYRITILSSQSKLDGTIKDNFGLSAARISGSPTAWSAISLGRTLPIRYAIRGQAKEKPCNSLYMVSR
jgi:hypothetical protein